MRGYTCIAVLVLACVACTGEIDSGSNNQQDDVDSGNQPTIDAPPANNNEPAGLTGITQLHNDVRASVGVGPMTWDPDLAAVAQAWVDLCTDNESPTGLIDHNDGRSDNYPGYVGENVYGSGGTATPADAVGLWAAEQANYDYASNTCSSVCGHYTQIVWATSVKLGCGLKDCPGLQFGSSLVCNYAPGGNSGGRPY